MTTCERCGKCCYLKEGNKFIRCKHLITLKSGKTLCRIYNKRLGQPLGHSNMCTKREYLKVDFPNCPFNTGKPLQGDKHE